MVGGTGAGTSKDAAQQLPHKQRSPVTLVTPVSKDKAGAPEEPAWVDLLYLASLQCDVKLEASGTDSTKPRIGKPAGSATRPPVVRIAQNGGEGRFLTVAPQVVQSGGGEAVAAVASGGVGGVGGGGGTPGNEVEGNPHRQQG